MLIIVDKVSGVIYNASVPDEGVNVKIGWPAGCMTSLCYLGSVALAAYMLYKGYHVAWALGTIGIGWFVANGVKANEARALLKDTLPSVKKILEGFGKQLPNKIEGMKEESGPEGLKAGNDGKRTDD